jgi:glyceraldehyde 3-phosphate dehydrogenase
MTVRIGVNGFGRTGRAMYRAVTERKMDVEIVALNDLAEPTALARLLTRDSVHGFLGRGAWVVDGDTLCIGAQQTKCFAEPEAEKLPWSSLGVDVVAECTGKRTNREAASAHLIAGAPRVVVSAPCKGADASLVIGVNEHSFDPEHHLVVDNASCTTNCVAVMARVLDDAFGIEEGFMTTVHAYTGDQVLVDGLHKDPRRGRSAALNIVPTTTGAARATGQVLPRLSGHLDGVSLRVPVPDGSITDLVVSLSKKASISEVNEAFSLAAASRLANVLECAPEPLVSTDIVGSRASCIFEPTMTMCRGRLTKVFGWYDNETGYASRLAELCELVGTR